MGNLACFSLFVTDLQELKDRVQRGGKKKRGGEEGGGLLFLRENEGWGVETEWQ